MSSSIVLSAWIEGLKPDKKMDIYEWSNNYRFLSSEGASEHGKYNMERMPYLIEIAKELSPSSETQYVFVCKGVQLGFTELGNNMLFTYADLYPCPILMVFPVKSLLKQHLDNKFWSGIKSTPKLKDKIKPVKQGATDSSSTTFIKFDGGSIVCAWSESKSTFASGSYRVAMLSDIDRFPDNVGGEGDTVTLAMKRLNSFMSNRKFFAESSPTKKKSSKIYTEVKNGDQRRYFMNCKECGEPFTFLENGFVYEYDDKNFLLKGDVGFACPHCGVVMSEYEKFEMMKLKNGARWIATNKEFNNVVRKTYFIGAYYSPFLSWNEIFQEYLDALADKERTGRTHKMKVWYNTLDGTTYDADDKDKKINVDIEDLMERREDYTNIPLDVICLSAGVDTQGDRFEVTIVGWKNSREKYIIAHIVINGDPKDVQTQANLDKVLFENSYPCDGGGAMKIFCSAIDTGGNKTDYVYEYVRQRAKRGIFAIKGGKSIDDPLVKTFSDVMTKKNKSLKLWILGVNSGKDEIIEDIKESFGIRYLHFPKYIRKLFVEEEKLDDEGYFEQLIAETQNSEGRWVNEFRRRNEALDCLIYAVASVKIRGLDLDKLAQLEKRAYFIKN